MRLIDADALEELFRDVIGCIFREQEITGNLEHMVRASAMCIQMIQDAPTVGIKCKDCKYYTANVFKNNGFNYGECHKLAIGLEVYAVEDWFCADGVKKDD